MSEIFDPTKAISRFEKSDWMDSLKNFSLSDLRDMNNRLGIMPVSTNGNRPIEPVNTYKQSFDLLEMATDAVLMDVISKETYVKLRHLLRTNSDDNLRLVSNILKTRYKR